VRKSAGLVLAIYSGYALIGSIGYWLAGMSWFDAVNHAFAAVSTGGFSTHSASISHWNSPALELVSLPLMFFGGLNFLTAHLLLTGRFKDVFRNSELRTFLVLFLIAVLVLTMFPQVEHASLWQRLRPALFEAMTALTTTGFNSVDYTGWRAVTVHLFLVLMIIGGGTGSTSGGLKQYRFLLLVSAVCWEIKRALLPRRAVFRPSVFMGQARQFIDDADLRRAGAFLVVYLAALGLGVGVLTAHGYPLADSLFEFASAQGTVGLSLGVTSANAPDPVLWAEILGMFLGRLEFFIVITSVARAWSLLRNTHRSS
jgi:trk system potassium uptake protein TrkH